MKLKKDDGLGVGGFLGQPRECSLGTLEPPEIVGQVENPTFEAIRRLWWRAFDRLCYWIGLMRLPIHDRIYGPVPATPADLKREADRMEKYPSGQNLGGESGSPYQ